jgi:hypothetical protein
LEKDKNIVTKSYVTNKKIIVAKYIKPLFGFALIITKRAFGPVHRDFTR